MDELWSRLGTLADLGLVVLGFTAIIFFHELGHFVAARWAGIRVLAFAIGFGPAAVSWRKGLGWRRGSSEGEYGERGSSEAAKHGISPTEYRLNWLPLGGYVKMLGQDDMDPSQRSDAVDSYQSAPVWKRMVVISAGVVMNVIVAAILFVVVFMSGLRVEPAKIGAVAAGSPAAAAVAMNAPAGEPAGLQPGDVVLEVNGRKPNSFGDLMIEGAMARKGAAVSLLVRREGVDHPLRFEVTPRMSRGTGLLDIGVSPAFARTVDEPQNAEQAAGFAELMDKVGAPGVRGGMTLVRAGDDTSIASGWDLVRAVRESGGRPVEAEFVAKPEDGGGHVVVTLHPEPMLQSELVPLTGPDDRVENEHLLGLSPVMTVAPDLGEMNERGKAQGLRAGDVFVRLGDAEYPSPAEGMGEIKRRVGDDVPATVLRGGEEVNLTPHVSKEGGGTIGFLRGDTRAESTLVARGTGASAGLNLRPGSRILSVDGREVGNFRELRAAIERAAEAARGGDATMRLVVQPPVAGAPAEEIGWKVSADDLRAVRGLKWTHRLAEVGVAFPFAAEEVTLKADGPLEAVAMGVSETRRVMVMTYITFARLFEGTVKVEHLKGPVGIAHLGTRIASRGLVWLLFFMALISVNLAVVNFLPLPIVDGGQFLFLVVEQVRGRPVSVAVQNAATAAGLLLIGAMFLVVTFNDIANLF